MMSLDCPLAIRHNKGEYKWLEIGGVFIYLYIFFEIFILELLIVSKCFTLYLFLAHDVFIFDVFIFYELYMIGGDIMFLFLFLVSHCATLIIDLYL